VCDPRDDATDGGFDPLRGNVRRGRLRERGCGASDDFAESGEAGVSGAAWRREVLRD
jgi:hypothetical protein